MPSVGGRSHACATSRVPLAPASLSAHARISFSWRCRVPLDGQRDDESCLSFVHDSSSFYATARGLRPACHSGGRPLRWCSLSNRRSTTDRRAAQFNPLRSHSQDFRPDSLSCTHPGRSAQTIGTAVASRLTHCLAAVGACRLPCEGCRHAEAARRCAVAISDLRDSLRSEPGGSKEHFSGPGDTSRIIGFGKCHSGPTQCGGRSGAGVTWQESLPAQTGPVRVEV